MENNLSDKQIAMLKEYFDTFKDSNSGNITLESLLTIMTCMVPMITEGAVVKLFTNFDYDRKGTLNFNELIECMKQILSQADPIEDFSREFKKFDKNKNGFITTPDLRRVIINLGLAFIDDDIECMIAEAEAEAEAKDGRL
ncbi:calmodulin-like [Teleopsis dalmanni]|uniref:calmodulin-like n=1 Tax=Teleopsis dalmanni TaxID=139649 RepID=UPI0018CC98A5|nr:calmodulin-like [Teleopsis dalmanni]